MQWTRHRNVLTTDAIPWAKEALWAPSVVEKDGRYYFFFSANDIKTDQETGGIVGAVGESLEPQDHPVFVAQCLGRQRQHGDLPYVGLIGSATKWATFRRRLRERGFSDAELDHVTCPIGVPGIKGKEPEVIAVAVAAQLLQRRSAVSARNQGNL